MRDFAHHRFRRPCLHGVFAACCAILRIKIVAYLAFRDAEDVGGLAIAVSVPLKLDRRQLAFIRIEPDVAAKLLLHPRLDGQIERLWNAELLGERDVPLNLHRGTGATVGYRRSGNGSMNWDSKMRALVAILLITGLSVIAVSAAQRLPANAYAEVLNGPPFQSIEATARRMLMQSHSPKTVTRSKRSASGRRRAR